MPESYEWALFFHILGVFLLAVSTAGFVLVIAMMRRSKDVGEVRGWATAAGILDALGGVAAVVVLLTGIWLVVDIGWSWDTGWINVSMIGLIVIAVAWVLINGRKVTAIRKAAADAPDGPVPQMLAVQLTDPVMFSMAHAATTGVLGIIWNMTTKPGDAQAGIVLVIALVVGALSAYPMVQRQQSIMEERR